MVSFKSPVVNGVPVMAKKSDQKTAIYMRDESLSRETRTIDLIWMNENRNLCTTELMVRFDNLTSIGEVSSGVLFDYADALRLVGRMSDSIKVYEALEERDLPVGKRWLVLLYKGQALMDSGKLREAEAIFLKSTEMNQTTVPRIYLSLCLKRQERFSDAISILREALSMPGDTDEVLLNLALNQRALGDLKSAEQNLKRAIEISPDYEDARSVLAEVTRALHAAP
jgi:tetratricopeptide (TPR) repeat protein